MTFDEWWGTLTTREQARMVKDDVAEAWQAAFQDGYEKGIAAFHEAVKVEREECAKVCESMIDPVDDEWRNKRPDEAAEFDASDAGKQACAAAIRARSNVQIEATPRLFAEVASNVGLGHTDPERE